MRAVRLLRRDLGAMVTGLIVVAAIIAAGWLIMMCIIIWRLTR